MVTTGKLTYDDLARFPDDGQRYEIIDGEVVVSPQPLLIHQWVSAELVRRLGNHMTRQRLGRVFPAPTAVILGPHDTFEPDVLFVSHARMAFASTRGIEGPPDLCIEIASPSTAERDRTTKFTRYAHYGVTEYWIIEPTTRSIAVFVLTDGVYRSLGVVSGRDRVPSRVLPDLRLRVASLFPPS